MSSIRTLLVGGGLLCVISAIYIRNVQDGDNTFPTLRHSEPLDIQIRDAEGALWRFAEGLRFKTVTRINESNNPEDWAAFDGLHAHFTHSYPRVFSKLQIEKVNEWSLLFKWPGRDSSLKPVLCISHQDVVPATSESAWTQLPFSGARAEGYIWGRGAQDVKITIFAMLEAVTALLHQGFQPKRTLYLAFGHDEEVGGRHGARAVADLLRKQGVQLAFVLDEGGPLLVDGLQPFIRDKAVALVGTAEKGYVSMDVSFRGKGGHSSLPPVDGTQAVTQLSRFLTDMHARLPAARIVPPTLEFLQAVGAASSNPVISFVLARCASWPLKPLLALFLARQPGEVAAAVRTTVAVTGVTTHPAAGNVLPSLATSQLNFRFLPGEAGDFAEHYLQSLLPKQADAEVKVHERHEMASAVTPVTGSAFAIVHQAIQETLAKDRVVATVPFLLTGGTDSKHYQDLCGGQTLRFMPVAMNRTAGDLKRIHGMDERVAEGAFLDAIRFYIRFFHLALGRDE